MLIACSSESCRQRDGTDSRFTLTVQLFPKRITKPLTQVLCEEKEKDLRGGVKRSKV